MNNFEKHHPAKEAHEETRELKEKVEKKLSPEIIEKIMEKVQDVNEEGTAYTTILRSYFAQDTDLDRIGSILKNGLLGKEKHKRSIDEIKQDWIDSMKNKRYFFRSKDREEAGMELPIVWFNIVGRSTNEKGDTSLTNSDLLNPLERQMGAGENATIIFDLSKYREVWFDSTSHLDTYTNSLAETEDTKCVDQMEGFFLSYRVPPRKFKGILIQCRRDNSEVVIPEYQRNRIQKLKDQDRIKYIKENFDHDEAMWLERAELLAQKMRQIYKDKENLLVPIYDVYGNLLWPKKMSYEEVQKFVEERAKEKIQKE